MSDTTLPDLLRVHGDPDPEPNYEDDDELVLPPSRGRLPRLTVGLLALVVLAAGFLGGALVQKHEGTSTVAAGRAGRTRGAGAGGAGGFAAFAGAAGFGGAAGAAGATGATGATGAAGATGTTAATPTVGPIAIGTVVSVSGTSLVVKDLGGNTRTITLGPGVTLTMSAPLTATSLKPGDTVTVSGTTAANGTTTATTVLRRTTN